MVADFLWPSNLPISQRQTAGDGHAGEAVTEVVNAEIVDPRRFPDAMPGLSDVDEVGSGPVADNDERIALDPGEGSKNLHSQRIQIDRLAAGFAVGKADQ